MKFKQSSLFVWFFCAIIAYLLITGPKVDIENETLLFILNTLFTGLIPITVAALSARAYLNNSLFNALLVSCGMLAFGLGSIITGLLSVVLDSENLIVTVYNICALTGALCHLFAALQGETTGLLLEQNKHVRMKLGLSLGVVCITVLIAVYGAVTGWIPPFVDSSGFTAIRNAVLWTAIAFYFAAAMFYLKLYRKLRSGAHYWFSLSLFMIALGLFGVCTATGVGTLLGWTGRLAQYFGACFALLSMIKIFEKAKDRNTALHETMAQFFSDSEGGYRRLTDASPDSILTIDHDYRIFIVNTSAKKLFKLDSDQIIGLSFLDLLEQPYKDQVSADLAVYTKTGSSEMIGYTKEMEARDSEGRVFPVEISFAGRREHSKCTVSLIIRDISERERSKKIERIKQSLEEAQQIAHMGSWEWHIGSDQLFWSKEMFRILGLDPETEAARRNLYFEQMIPNDSERVMEARDRALKMGDPFDVEFRIINPDGKMKHIQSVAATHCGSDGQAVTMTGTLQDITERRLAEEEEERHAAFEKTILHLAQNFINTPGEAIHDAMDQALQAVGEYAGVDRVTVYRFEWDEGQARHMFEWDRLTENYAGDKLPEIPLDKLGTIIECISTGREYTYSSLIHDNSKFDEVTKQSGCVSGIVFPLMINNSLFGSIGLAITSDVSRQSINRPVIRVFSEMISNVLQRIETERSLRNISESNRLMLDSTLDGIAMLDPQGKVLNMNKSFLSRQGVPKDAIGKNLLEITPDQRYGNLAGLRYQKLRQVVETKEPAMFEDERDGVYSWNRYYPVVTDGAVSAVTLFSTNVTDRKKAEETARRNAELLVETEMLRKKEQEYLEILDGSTEASWICDFKDGTLKYSHEWKKRIGGENVSDENMYLYAMTLLHPDDFEKVTLDRKALYEAKLTKYKNEYRFRVKTGEYIWVYDQGKIVYDEKGNPVKIYGTSMDITERKNAEEAIRKSESNALALVEELKQADKNKNEFLSALSHELRNPLASIVLGLSIMEMSDEEEQKKRTAETVKRQVDQMCRLVDDLLHLTRITQNRIIIRKELVEFNRLAETIVQDFKSAFEDKGICLTDCITSGDINIDADPVRVKQAIGNLLCNALKFTDTGGKVMLSVYRQEKKAVVSVKDNGIGIRTEFLHKVFDPFTQADESLERTNGGLGLGLSIVKGIAELHGGSADVYSEGPGKGSEFTIRFPVSKNTKETA